MTAFQARKARLDLKPFADDGRALLAVYRPGYREAVFRDVVGLDAERVLNDLGSVIAVVALDGLWRRLVMRVLLAE